MWTNRKLEWKIGEPGSTEVIKKNVEMMDGLFKILTKKCGNPYCKYPISALRLENYAVPIYGDVCAVCRDLYTAVGFNEKLLMSSYFRNHHEEWKKEQDEFKKKRRNMGLDGGLL